MTGAIFFRAEFTSPWALELPALQDYAHLLAPGTERLVSYHLMTEGDAVARFGDGREVFISEGDVLVIPHGDPHVMSNGQATSISVARGDLALCLSGDISTLRIGGGEKKRTSFVVTSAASVTPSGSFCPACPS